MSQRVHDHEELLQMLRQLDGMFAASQPPTLTMQTRFVALVINQIMMIGLLSSQAIFTPMQIHEAMYGPANVNVSSVGLADSPSPGSTGLRETPSPTVWTAVTWSRSPTVTATSTPFVETAHSSTSTQVATGMRRAEVVSGPLLTRLARNKPSIWGNEYFYVGLGVVYVVLLVLFFREVIRLSHRE